jgi:hypothetical protein
MYTTTIKFGSDEDHIRFIHLYRREKLSQFRDEPLSESNDVMSSLDDKEFINVIRKVKGATLFKLSEKGYEFASTFVDLP